MVDSSGSGGQPISTYQKYFGDPLPNSIMSVWMLNPIFHVMFYGVLTSNPIATLMYQWIMAFSQTPAVAAVPTSRNMNMFAEIGTVLVALCSIAS